MSGWQIYLWCWESSFIYHPKVSSSSIVTPQIIFTTAAALCCVRSCTSQLVVLLKTFLHLWTREAKGKTLFTGPVELNRWGVSTGIGQDTCTAAINVHPTQWYQRHTSHCGSHDLDLCSALHCFEQHSQTLCFCSSVFPTLFCFPLKSRNKLTPRRESTAHCFTSEVSCYTHTTEQELWWPGGRWQEKTVLKQGYLRGRWRRRS